MQEDIKNKITRDFGSNHLTVIDLVEKFEAEEKLSPRITRCIVHLAKGDLTKLESGIQSAKYDWRDVIFWAEARPLEFNHPFGSPENLSRANFDKLKEFIVEQVGVEENAVTPYTRLYEDIGVYGDDATELLIEYGKRFNVDVSKFMAADYFKGEGIDVIGGLIRFFSGKQSTGLKILTVNDLEKGIVAGRLDDEVISPQPTDLEWLLLRIIDAVPAWRNGYRLERFFAKTDVCLTFYKDLAGLVIKNWLAEKDPKAQVKEYVTTEEGRRLLAAEYSTLNIRDYVMSIEPTGFILGLLEKMDDNSTESSGA